MDIKEKLEKAGLTKNESKVYLELIKNGESSANEIAKNLSLDRTLTYTLLNHLIEKGQVNYIIKQNKKFFSCADPENLLNKIKAKELLISNLITDLKKIKPEKQNKTEINIYEGVEGIRTFINLVLKQKDFCAFGSTGMTFFTLYEMPMIMKKVEKMKVNIRVIGNENKKSIPYKSDNIKYKYLNIKSKATTSIFGDYVSIHMVTEKPFFILIKNKEISNSYREHFNYLWKLAKKTK